MREGPIIPMAPIMNYMDEFEIKEIELKITLFEKNGCSSFVIPVNIEKILVKYIAKYDDHHLKIGKSRILCKIDTLGKDESKLRITQE